jgi:hypothetical protein
MLIVLNFSSKHWPTSYKESNFMKHRRGSEKLLVAYLFILLAFVTAIILGEENK